MKNTGHKSKESSFNGIVNFLVTKNIVVNHKESGKTFSNCSKIIIEFLKSNNIYFINKKDNLSNKKNSIQVQKNWQKFLIYIDNR